MATGDGPAEALRAELERERALFAEGPVVVFRWRAADGWPVEHVSSNVLHLFGWPAEAFLSGQVPYASVIHPDDLARVGEEVATHAASGGTHFEQDYRIVDREGNVRWLFDQTRVLRDDAGGVTHFLGYVFDVTARRRAEAALRERDEQLAHAQRTEALGRLAGGVAHDFGNLLTALGGHLDLARSHLPSDHPAQRSLAIARRTVDRGAALTGQLLAVARRQPAHPRALDLAAAVREAVEFLGPLLGDDLVVNFDAAPEPLRVRADPTQLQQVLLNLALNARDAMPAGGSLTFATHARGAEAALTLTDTGVGMDEATAARVFEPFFSARAGGTGLGLATVAAIVAESGGRIRLESAPGRGTTVEVVLPRVDEEELEAPTPPPPRARRARVLLAEDNPDIRELVAEVLGLEGHEVLATASGAAALEGAERFRPDLLITDVSMPGMSGVDLADALTARGWTGPVLFVSGHAHPVRLPEGRDRRLLRKPFGVDALLHSVGAMLEAGGVR
jgi:two-component system cell cycle sensor histidine kinase/response regulator CckA